jgi:hypothetical protein
MFSIDAKWACFAGALFVPVRPGTIYTIIGRRVAVEIML